MAARDADEPHRASTQLELLLDLTFVVAIASITKQLAHGIENGAASDVLTPFLQVFFAIWWAWMNFTWFASSYDTDDVPYRLMTLIQMGGVLVLAAGVPAAVQHADYRAITAGYLIMRIGLVAQWIRAARECPEGRSTAVRYAAGITTVQVGWLLRLIMAETGALPPASAGPIFIALDLLELAVPPWAERRGRTTWHPHHIAERYGLFTIILLSESVLAASTGLERALSTGRVSAPLVTVAISGLVLLFALWWLYFLESAGDGLAHHRQRSYLWGYGSYGVFVALAALGAGLEVAVELTDRPAHITGVAMGLAVAIPVAAFLLFVGAMQALLGSRSTIRPAVISSAAAAVLLLPLTADVTGPAITVTAIAAVCTLVVALTISQGRSAVGRRRRSQERSDPSRGGAEDRPAPRVAS